MHCIIVVRVTGGVLRVLCGVQTQAVDTSRPPLNFDLLRLDSAVSSKQEYVHLNVRKLCI